MNIIINSEDIKKQVEEINNFFNKNKYQSQSTGNPVCINTKANLRGIINKIKKVFSGIIYYVIVYFSG